MNAKVVFPQAVYRRRKEPGELPANLRLRALEWALYFGVTGRHTVAELGRQMRAQPAEIDEALARLMSFELIEERDLDASEYVIALATTGDHEEKTLLEFMMSAAQPAATLVGDSATAGRPRVSQQTAADNSAVRLPAQALPDRASRPQLRGVATTPVTSAGTPPQPRASRPSFGFDPLPLPDDTKESRSMSGSRKLSLRALMKLIEGQAGSREVGQLDIYRVFVRVDTLLLKRNGIESLRFTEDRLVSDPDLEQAIVRSVKKTLGLDCPESVWVEVA
jgi:hypothetical protein